MDGHLRIRTKLDNSGFNAQIKATERKLQDLKQTLASNNKGSFKLTKNEIIDLKKEIEKTTNQLNRLKVKQSELNNVNFNNMTGGLRNSCKSAKKLALGILSISGAYALISKASSSYLATDSTTTNQIEANWVGLGTILEPVIKMITGLMKKAVTSILYFMSALTGTDYIAKANANAIKKQTQAVKELNKENDKYTASFDEMDIYQNPNSSNTLSSGIDTGVLFDINDISEKTRNAIDKIADALKPIYEMLKNIIGWALENPNVVMGILGGVALAKGLASVIGMAGAGGVAGTGLAGIYGLLLAIASIGVITICIKTVVDEWKKMEDDVKGAEKNIKGVEKGFDGLAKKSIQLGKTVEKNTKQVSNLNKIYSSTSKSFLEDLKIHNEEWMKMSNSFFGIEKAIGECTGETKLLRDAQESCINSSYQQIVAYYDLYRQGKLNDEQTEEYIATLKDFIITIGSGGTSINELTNKFGLSRKEASEVQKKYNDVSAMLVQVTNSSDDTSDSIFNLNGIMGKIPSIIKTTLVTNANQTLNELEQTHGLIEKMPSIKDILIKTKVVADVDQAESKIKNLFNTVSSTSSSVLKAFGININMPKLAVGGIVNNPGRGVPIGGAITGEAGTEGVIPLTDSQAMDELGSSIGNHMTVNLTTINKMDGRTISRQQSKVKTNKDFALNL